MSLLFLQPGRPSMPAGLIRMALALLAGITLAACGEDQQSVGNNLVQPPAIQQDSSVGFSLESRQLDELQTGFPSFFLFGELNDPLFGFLRAETYSEFRLGGANIDFGDSTLTLDSLVLQMSLATTYGNPAAPHQLQVFELDEAFVEDASAYTNRSSAAAVPGPVGEKTIDFEPNDTTLQLRIRLDDALGTRLLNADSAALSTDQNFTEFFKGLMIRTNALDTTQGEYGTIWSAALLASNSFLRMHYTLATDSGPQARTFDFVANNDAPGFNSLFRSNTAGRLIESEPAKPAADQAALLLQAGNPVAIQGKINQADLETLTDGGINEAILTLWLDQDRSPTAEGAFFRAPTILQAFVNNPDGTPNLNDPIFTVDQVQRFLSFDQDAQAFRIDLTSYVQQLRGGVRENTGFTILPLLNTTRGQSASRAVLHGLGSADKPPRLRIFFTPANN